MAIETRTIVFNETELIDAAYAYCVREDLAPKKGRLRAVVADADAEDRIRLLFDGGVAGASNAISISFSQMAAGLILYCASSGIPLPRYARKRLTPAGEGMALVIRLPEYAGEAVIAEGPMLSA